MFFRACLEGFAILCAVYGFYSILCAIVRAFSSDQIAVAVLIDSAEALQSLDALLQEATFCACHRPSSPVVVLLAQELTADGEEIPEDVQSLLDLYGADCFLVDRI
ncbi:MAG: hypothetical protein IKB75_00035 [Clostridia bacterium]|nr:hypothetical protein [Clostridia bacterium]